MPRAQAKAFLKAEAATPEEILGILEPEVGAWFSGAFPGFTPPQLYAVKHIHEGHHVLISSPTGSGKTLSAFLAAINELTALWKRGKLEDKVYVLYVSPLKALNNDIERNLKEPLAGIRKVFEGRSEAAPEIRVAVRTGDTSQADRAKQVRTPPHILITTPESLAILLNSPKYRTHLDAVRWLIVDEVHALAENKRGTHLALSLERLVDGFEREPVRVGLSATVHPLDDMAHFLVGGRMGKPRPCRIVDVSYLKQTEIRVGSPVEDVINTSPEAARASLDELLDELIEAHRTTLVFTNTRAGTERVVHHLKDRFPKKYEELIGAHHGSLSRDRRVDVEQALKEGKLKAVVCSTSLELGIDIGYVDLVVLLSSPKSVSRALQRIGRSGHRLHETSRGRLVSTDRDDLVECTVLAAEALMGHLDRVHAPEGCLDVLCQHLVGMSLEKKWDVQEAYALVTRAWPFRELGLQTFRRCLTYLGGADAAMEERRVYGKVWYDPDAGVFGRRGRMARPIYYMNVGTIPDTSQVKVFHADRFIGTLEEDFVERLVPGDVFVLGGSTWRFRSAAGARVRVETAKGRGPTVPAWFSESLPLSRELASRIEAFRADVAAWIRNDGPDAAAERVAKQFPVDARGAHAIVGYIHEQSRYAEVPGPETVLVEQVEDGDRTLYVFHTLVGRRCNDALSRAFARRVMSLTQTNVGVLVNDNGFAVVVPRYARLTDDQIRSLFLIELDLELEAALERSELLLRRFRHVATRAFLVLRNYMGHRFTVNRQQVNAKRLLTFLREHDPHHPVVREAYREVMEDAMDAPAAREFLHEVVTRRRRVHILRELPAPSPFAFNLVTAASQDAVLQEDRARVLRQLHRRVLVALGDLPKEEYLELETGGATAKVRWDPSG